MYIHTPDIHCVAANGDAHRDFGYIIPIPMKAIDRFNILTGMNEESARSTSGASESGSPYPPTIRWHEVANSSVFLLRSL